MIPTAARPHLWLCGATTLPEFQPCREWLTARFALQEVNPEQSTALPSESPFAILDVRDTWSPAAGPRLESLAAQHPLAILLQFLGPWCDGMGRSPGFLPGVIRVGWQNWEAELPDLLLPRNYVPRTATEADRLLEFARQRSKQLGGVVGVVAHSRVTTEGLVEAVQACGAQGIALREPAELSHSTVDRLLIDLDGARDQDQMLSTWLAAAPSLPITILAGFARPEDIQAWKSQGITAVVTKPCSLATLQKGLQGESTRGRECRARTG